MKKCSPQKITLKNNKSVLIREADLQDAEKLLTCLKTYIPQSDYIPKFEHEIKLTVEQEKTWIDSLRTNENSLLLVAEYQDRIIGNIDVTVNQREAMRHTAVVGMGMLKEWQNIGLGTALLSAAINWAIQNKTLEILWLQVYTENSVGVNLYKKMGFTENGIIKNFFKQNNTYFDQLTMSRSVKQHAS